MGEPEGVSHSSSSKNQSLNKIIDHMTSDLQSYDGQYIVLGAPGTASTNTQHIWPDYTSQSGQPVTGVPVHSPVFVQQPYEIQDRMMQASQHGLFYPNPPSIREATGEMIGMVDVGGGNFVNVVINPTNPPNTIHPFIPGLHAESNMGFVHYQQSHNQPPHVLNTPPVSSEYGLFKTNNETVNQNNHQLIENVVGNWLPNKSGTYSPFGSVPQAYKTEDSTANLPGQLKKPRMVAEVRPMRPTYSDVLAKSVPPLTPPPTTPKTPTLSGSLKGEGKKQNSKGLKVLGSSCGGTKTMSSNPLKRQYSNEEQAPNVKHWISMDDLTSQTEERSFINYEGGLDENIGSCSDNFVEHQSEENKKEKKQRKKNKSAEDKCEALNNCKSSGTINGSGKRPLHINNNLQSKDLSSQKNVTQTTDKNPRFFHDDHKKGTSNFSYVGGGTSKYNTIPEEKGPSVTRVSKGGGSNSSGLRKNQRSIKRREGQNYLRLLWRKWQDQITYYGLLFLTWFLHLIWDVLAMSARLFVHLCAGMGETGVLWLSWLHNRLIRLVGREGWWNWWEKKPAPLKSSEPTFPGGLTSNISLPATGDEAMKRLLACKGKDPYSILGVTNHCTDDDIKKYYKRQAVLVHPDKNSQPGAEEAFKILVHAFELIGEPERRSAYDRCVAETHQVEQAWSELSELLSQLHHKMEYAANTIRCTKCGKRHKRVIMQRPCYAARFCAQCKIHHSAREGDIWAESWLLGMLWHYYACMEGAVYDISEWAACQAENLKHLKANSHAVQYRIVLGKQNHHHHRKEDYNEPDLEEFLNNLYTQSDKGTGEGLSGGNNCTRQRRKGKRKK